MESNIRIRMYIYMNYKYIHIYICVCVWKKSPFACRLIEASLCIYWLWWLPFAIHVHMETSRADLMPCAETTEVFTSSMAKRDNFKWLRHSKSIVPRYCRCFSFIPFALSSCTFCTWNNQTCMTAAPAFWLATGNLYPAAHHRTYYSKLDASKGDGISNANEPLIK